jgi:hypothetical protein
MSEQPEKPKPEVIHIKKFADGKETPREMHRRIAFAGRKCFGCGSHKVAIRIKTLAPVDEITKRNPSLVAALIARNPLGPFLQTIKTRHGAMLLVADISACDLCQSEAEKAAARGPSWVIVDIDRGPDDDKPMVQVH